MMLAGVRGLRQQCRSKLQKPARHSFSALRTARGTPVRGFSALKLLDEHQAQLQKDKKAYAARMEETKTLFPEVSDWAAELRAELDTPQYSRWRALITPEELVLPEVAAERALNSLAALRSHFAQVNEVVRSAPESIPPIDWADWTKRIRHPTLVAQTKAVYEKMLELDKTEHEIPVPKELQAKVDAQWKEVGEKVDALAAASQATAAEVKVEIKELEDERAQLDNLTVEELLIKHPLVADMIEKELEDDHWGPALVTPKEDIEAALHKEFQYKREGRLHELYPEHWQRENGYIK